MTAATLVRLGPLRRATRRLYCLPFAGGGVAAYAHWWRALPDDVEVIGVQLPGREQRLNEAPLTSIGAMADIVLDALRTEPDLPYAIFGHSMGALVAFELVLRIEADVTLRTPSHLFLSGRRAPGTQAPVTDMSDLDDSAFLDALQVRFGAVTDEVRSHAELLGLLMPILRADVLAVESYRVTAGQVVQCPVDVCGGDDDLHPTPAALAGWQSWVSQPMGVRSFPGGHFYLVDQRDALLRWLAETWLGPQKLL